MGQGQTKQDHITFTVSEGLKSPSINPPEEMQEIMLDEEVMRQKKGRVLLKTTNNANQRAVLGNGFVGSAFRAYSDHCHLVISPDSVWIAITTTLASYIDRNSERMRGVFVSHEGKKLLEVIGGGSLMTANYDWYIERMVEMVDQETKDDIKSWLECSFSTTTPLIKTVSKLVVMGAMKNYFDYKMTMKCGLPGVTLTGTAEDWKDVRKRVDRLVQIGAEEEELLQWASILGNVLDHFVGVFDGRLDKGWWNSIVNHKKGQSGPSYLSGWILAFCPWTKDGKFILVDPEKNGGSYGKIDTSKIPSSTVEVPVLIDDNGKKYKVIFYAGNIHSKIESSPEKAYPFPTISSVQDWALINVTDEK